MPKLLLTSFLAATMGLPLLHGGEARDPAVGTRGLPRVHGSADAPLPVAIKGLPRHTRGFIYSKQGLRHWQRSALWRLGIDSLPPEQRASVEALATEMHAPIIVAAIETGYREFDNLVFFVAVNLTNVSERWGALLEAANPLTRMLQLQIPEDPVGEPGPVSVADRQVGFLAASRDWVFFSNVEAVVRSALQPGWLGAHGSIEQSALFRGLRAWIDLSAELLAFVDLSPVWQLVESQTRSSQPGGMVPLSLWASRLRELTGLVAYIDASALHIIAGIQGGNQGLWRLVAQDPKPCPLLTRVPGSYHLVARTAIGSGDDLSLAYREVLGRIDPDVASEFDREVRDIGAECGLDLREQLLSNLSGDCVVAFRIKRLVPRPSVEPLLITGVRDRPELQAAIEKLNARLEKPGAKHQDGPAVVYERDMGLPFRALGLSNGVFVLSPTAEEARHVLRGPVTPAVTDHARIRTLAKQPTSSFLAVPDLSALFKAAGVSHLMAPLNAAGQPQLGHVIASAFRDKVELRFAFEMAEGSFDALSQAALIGITAARGRARVQMCRSNLKQIGLACAMHAQDHKGKLPTEMKGLKPYLGPERQLLCPLTGVPYELLQPGQRFGKPAKGLRARDTMLVRDATPHPDGKTCIVFMDGHVEGPKRIAGGKTGGGNR